MFQVVQRRDAILTTANEAEAVPAGPLQASWTLVQEFENLILCGEPSTDGRWGIGGKPRFAYNLPGPDSFGPQEHDSN